MKRAFLETPYGQIHYRNDGKGDPPLILFHSTPLSSFEYLAMIPSLAVRRQVIAMDTIGYGDSDKPSENKWYTIEDYAKTALMLIDFLKIEKAIFVGHHTGSKIAIEMAARYPERVERVILLGPYFWETAEWWGSKGLLQKEAVIVLGRTIG